jgi:hypothetical protein
MRRIEPAFGRGSIRRNLFKTEVQHKSDISDAASQKKPRFATNPLNVRSDFRLRPA